MDHDTGRQWSGRGAGRHPRTINAGNGQYPVVGQQYQLRGLAVPETLI